MQTLTLVILPSSLVAVPLLAGFGRASRRESSKSGRTKSHLKDDRPQPERIPPKRKPKKVRPPAEVHLSVEVPPGTKVRVTVGKAVTGQKKAAAAKTHDQVFEVPQEPEPRSSADTAAGTGRVRLPAISTGQFRAFADSLGSGLQSLGERIPRALGDGEFRRGLLGPAGWMALSLAVYLIVRLYDLASYPVYFFTDEAVQTVLAADLVQAGFRDFLGHYLPTYFQNVYEFNLSLSVYAQVLPFMIFGKSVFVTRATAVLLTLPGAAAIGLSLRDVLHARYPWIGILLLSCTPAWFLHSRTAFETSLMVSFYACFLYCYLLYRTRSPKYLYPALVFAAAVFYAYGPGEIIILGTGILLLASDARFHWEQRKTIARGLLLGLLLALPYIRFRLQLPEEHAEALRLLESIWVMDVPLSQKLGTSLEYYTSGLSPFYWFLTNTRDMGRHVMGEYANLMTWTLPFVLGGIAIAVRRVRRPEYRAVLACVLAIPLGGAVAGAGITRLLSMVVPASILSALALDAVADWLTRLVRPRVVGASIFLGLSLVSFGLLRDALVNGPLWNRNYGMDIPWGGPEVFGAVEELIQQDPDVFVYVSPTWANGVDTLARFFLPDGAPVDIANADRFAEHSQDLADNMVLVLTASEFEAARTDPKFADVRYEKLISYPDGSPGFYFVRMRYSALADTLVEQERLERQRPIIETVVVGGHTYTVEHPFLDSGTIQHMFDGDTYTLARGYEANPLILRITFDAPRSVDELVVTTGSMDFGLTVRLYPAGGSEPKVYARDFLDLPDDPTVTLVLDQPPDLVERMDIEITQLGVAGPSKLHIREIELK